MEHRVVGGIDDMARGLKVKQVRVADIQVKHFFTSLGDLIGKNHDVAHGVGHIGSAGGGRDGGHGRTQDWPLTG